MEPVLPPVWVCMFALSTLDKSTITNIYGTYTSIILPTGIYLHNHRNIYMIKKRHLRRRMKGTKLRWPREQPDIFEPVSIGKTIVVGRQIKDTSAVSITTVTFKNHGHATRLIFIQSTKLYALPVQHGNLQRRINIIRNSNPTQLNSNGARRNRGSNNGGGSIQIPSSPPLQQNRKSIKVYWLWKFQINTISIKSIYKGWLTVKITNKQNSNSRSEYQFYLTRLQWQNTSTTKLNNKRRSNEESRWSRYPTEETFIKMIQN